ncbi:MAG: sensor histidine kinase [Terriglobales bacterium]
MAVGLGEARLRLAYINQYRELALALLLALAFSLRLLGWSLPWLAVALFGLWFLLACGFVRLSNAAADERRLNLIEFGYFICELALITLIAVRLGRGDWLPLLFYLVTILHAHMVLPRRTALGLTAVAAACFALLHAHRAGWLRHPLSPAALLGLVAVLALVYGLAGLSVTRFSLMLNRQAEALQTANRDLNATSKELRLHRDHLERLVRERTAQLERANADLVRANALKSEFLASVSHELRTPLSSIQSFSELLLRYPDEDAATRCEFLEIIHNETGRLSRLINDVLDLARIEAGRLQLRPQPVGLVDVVREAVEVFQILAAQEDLELRCEVAEDLPLVEADPDRLRQIFTNLLSNAFKFTAHGSIVIGASTGNGEMLIWVADTGIGVPPGEEEHIFEKFHQLGDTLTGKPAGTGLGLAICRELCQRLGGRLWAQRRPEGGSIFYLTLPLAPARARANLAP